MKVLQAINGLDIGGAEKLVLDIVPSMQKKNISVDVLLLKDQDTSFVEALKNKTSGNIFSLTKGSIYNPLLIFKIIPYLKNYDIIHIHLFPTLYWIVIAKLLSFSKTKLVYTEHSTSNRRRNKILMKHIDKIIYKNIDKIVTIADDVNLKLTEHLGGINRNKVQIINNGVDIDNFTNAKPYEKKKFFSNSDFILIQVSSFRYPKDQATIINALKLLPSDVKLMLVGDGILREEYERLVGNIELSNRVLFLGNRNDIPQLLQTADIAILSSHYEGLSLASIEGMACKPFIASNSPGLSEIVDGYGLLFETGNAQELAELILKLKNDKHFYTLTQKSCFKRANQYNINNTVESYITLYKGLI